MFMKLFSFVLSMAISAYTPAATIDRIEKTPNGDIAVIEIYQTDGNIHFRDVETEMFTNRVEAGEKLEVKTVIGTFTNYSLETGFVQFKDYTNEVWWYLSFEEIGFVPDLNKPYALSYFENYSKDCNHKDCDDCYRENDILLHVEKVD